VYSDNPAVIALAASLLLVVAVYHFADALQTLCVFVLRCYRVTLAPLLIYCTMLWGHGPWRELPAGLSRPGAMGRDAVAAGVLDHECRRAGIDGPAVRHAAALDDERAR
jgi:Na+-driven multidrug efflux pump